LTRSTSSHLLITAASLSPSLMLMSPVIHIVRHGEGVHNVQRGYPHRDAPLTEAGIRDAQKIVCRLGSKPDLILISPMTRTIQTAVCMFPFLSHAGNFDIPVQIWPDLREANDAICNKGLGRADLQSKYPQFDFSGCPEVWDHPPHTIENATARAERVRQRLRGLSTAYQNILIITHRGLIAFLVKGRRFNLCETRSYRFATNDEMEDEKIRFGLNCDTLQEQDFGPTLLMVQEQLVEHH
jgi:broad specificity phosphatase PhoE